MPNREIEGDEEWNREEKKLRMEEIGRFMKEWKRKGDIAKNGRRKGNLTKNEREKGDTEMNREEKKLRME